MTESKGDNHAIQGSAWRTACPAPSKSSLVITDPPYNRNFQTGRASTTTFHVLTTTTLVDTFDKLYDEYTNRTCSSSTPRSRPPSGTAWSIHRFHGSSNKENTGGRGPTAPSCG